MGFTTFTWFMLKDRNDWDCENPDSSEYMKLEDAITAAEKILTLHAKADMVLVFDENNNPVWEKGRETFDRELLQRFDLLIQKMEEGLEDECHFRAHEEALKIASLLRSNRSKGRNLMVELSNCRSNISS